MELNKKAAYLQGLVDGLGIDDTTKEGKIIIEGCNLVTKHVKPRKQGDPAGIMKAESAVYACKVMAVCPKCGKATRLAHKIEGDTKTRVCKHCGASY